MENETLKVGDIVWAKRYQTEEERNKIHKGHQEGPYIIIKKNKRVVLGLQCTSIPHSELSKNKVFYFLGKLTYGFHKHCYVSTIKTYNLTKERIIKKIGTLTKYDQNKILKYMILVLKQNKNAQIDLKKNDLKFEYEIGDIIILSNNRYYIYDIDFKYYYCYPVKVNQKFKNRILIDNTYYSFNIEKIKKISRRRRPQLLDTLNTGEIKKIKNYLENIEPEKEKIPKVGSLIIYKELQYYIFNEAKEEYKAIQIFGSQLKENQNMGVVIINGACYYTYFNQVLLSKNKIYTLKNQALQNEIEMNQTMITSNKKYKRKLRTKMMKEAFLTKKYDTKEFTIMTILYNVQNKQYYLILNKEDKLVEVVNINDFSDYFFMDITKNTIYRVYKMMGEEEFRKYKKKVEEYKFLAQQLIRE